MCCRKVIVERGRVAGKRSQRERWAKFRVRSCRQVESLGKRNRKRSPERFVSGAGLRSGYARKLAARDVQFRESLQRRDDEAALERVENRPLTKSFAPHDDDEQAADCVERRILQ